MAERGTDASALLRPFSNFSLERWDGEGAKDGDLREEGEELLRRRCEGEADWFRQAIFSRLTTGRDTLKRKQGLKKRKQGNADKEPAPTMSCSVLPLVGRRPVVPC